MAEDHDEGEGAAPPWTIVAVVVGGDDADATDVQVRLWLADASHRHDLAAVDALARLGLWARRLGWTVDLEQPGTRLHDLLELTGLSDVLARSARLDLELGRQPEGGEQLGVEEVVPGSDATP